VKDYVRKIKKANPLYFLAVGLILIVVVVIVLTSGGDDSSEQAHTVTKAPALKKNKAKAKRPKGRHVKAAPIGSSGVIDQARREGDFVVAQARGTIKNPFSVRLRVSAAPKQRVTVDWQLSCFKNRQVRIGKGKYKTKAPDERHITLPMSGAETCIATAGAQLTRHGKGRVKVSVVAG
jgi:hypothetical protein